jgi:predicted nucleic acid-binding protein
VKRCVLDTDVVIGALDRQDAHYRQASSTLLAMIADDIAVHLCVVNYAEALVKPAEDDTALRKAVDAIAALRIQLHSPNAAISRDAARLRALNISLADGFALATAKHLSASIASFDSRVQAAARHASVPLAQTPRRSPKPEPPENE